MADNDNENNQENKINHILSFEDLDKPIRRIGNTESSMSLNFANLDLKLKPSYSDKSSTIKNKPYVYEKKLTANSRKNLTIRLLIIILLLIFIPFQSISYNSLTLMEKNYIFNHIEDLVSYETLSSDSPINIFNIFRFFLNKDCICCISCLFYSIVHPFIALKLIYSVCIIFYFITIAKCYYQSNRPLWEEDIGKNDIIKCETSFSNPSAAIFVIHFYFLYSIFCIKEFYNKDRKMNLYLKIILFLIYIGISIFEYIFLLLYKLNFLHEIVFTNIITLILVCILIDFDRKYQKKFYNATKTIFKARKNKIKAFIFCFGLAFLAILLYNFISLKNSLFSVEQKLAANKSCSQNQKEELGLKSTLNDIPYLFCMMGAFWGACLAIENNPGEWWFQPLFIDEKEISKINDANFEIIREEIGSKEIIFLIIKCIIMGITFFLIWFIFYQISYISFEFNFLISCIKYFCLNFICTGIMPIVFGFLKMNKTSDYIDVQDNNSEIIFRFDDTEKEKKKNTKNLFSPTLFVEYYEKARYPFLHIKLIKNEEDKNKMIYSFSEYD
jgi:hypothetical protein